MTMPVRVMDHWINRYQSVIDERVNVLRDEHLKKREKCLKKKEKISIKLMESIIF